MTWTCKNCGQPNLMGDRICRHCGKGLRPGKCFKKIPVSRMILKK